MNRFPISPSTSSLRVRASESRTGPRVTSRDNFQFPNDNDKSPHLLAGVEPREKDCKPSIHPCGKTAGYSGRWGDKEKTSPHLSRRERGIGIIDVVISIAIIVIAFFSISQIAILGLRMSREAVAKLEAVYLGEEGIEIARVLRDESWATYVNGLNSGTNYFPTLSGSRWTLSTTDPGPINNRFTRTLRFNQVCRDPAGDNIVNCSNPGAAVDTNTREVVSSLSWGDVSQAKVYRITTYLTNFLTN